MIPDRGSVDVFIGIDAGMTNHHAVALGVWQTGTSQTRTAASAYRTVPFVAHGDNRRVFPRICTRTLDEADEGHLPHR